jgi:N-methylhydantoinase B/oxoprolinase/acetone carboxylase alpha subunit
MGELAERHGHNALMAMFEELLTRSETMTRQALARIPSGTYRYVDFLDNDGIDLDMPIRIEVGVTVHKAGIHIDFTGTAPQVRGPMNCVPSGSLAAACFAIRALTDPAIPTNAGCFRPISLYLPKGSLVNPEEPAPVNARTSTIKRITGAIIAALAEVLPSRVPAPGAGEMALVAFGGRHPSGSNFVTGDLIASGSGASAMSDGVDVIETDATNCMNLPAEAMDGGADPVEQGGIAGRLGRCRAVPRRSGHRAGI